MVISARAILKPKKDWDCEHQQAPGCQIRIGRRPHLRLYGAAFAGDRPYAIRICVPCAHVTSEHQKIGDALDDLERRRKELAE